MNDNEMTKGKRQINKKTQKGKIKLKKTNKNVYFDNG